MDVNMADKSDAYLHHPDLTGIQTTQPELEVVQEGLNPVEVPRQDFQSPTTVSSAHPTARSPAYTSTWTPTYAPTSVKSSDAPDYKAESSIYHNEAAGKGTVRRSTLIACLVAAFVLLIAVGLGVGLGVSARKNKELNRYREAIPTKTCPTSVANMNATAVSSNVTTTSLKLPLPTTGFVPLDCPALDSKTYTSVVDGITASYHLRCDVLWSNTRWFTTFPAYTIDACIQACSVLNNKQQKLLCYGVTFVADLSQISSMHGNCFLKNETGPYISKPLNEHWIAAELDTSQSSS